MYGHRAAPPPPPPGGMVASRFLDLLEALRNEYEVLYQEINLSKMHREDHEMKAHTQLVDITGLQKSLVELEIAHVKMKQQYDFF